jgi:hypothetical protein
MVSQTGGGEATWRQRDVMGQGKSTERGGMGAEDAGRD